MASRNGFAPHVIAYWLISASIARLAASLISAGAAKSGNPCARLIALCLIASLVMSRMTDSVKLAAFLETRMIETVHRRVRSRLVFDQGPSGRLSVANLRLTGVRADRPRRHGSQSQVPVQHVETEHEEDEPHDLCSQKAAVRDYRRP